MDEEKAHDYLSNTFHDSEIPGNSVRFEGPQMWIIGSYVRGDRVRFIVPKFSTKDTCFVPLLSIFSSLMLREGPYADEHIIKKFWKFFEDCRDGYKLKDSDVRAFIQREGSRLYIGVMFPLNGRDAVVWGDFSDHSGVFVPPKQERAE